MIRTSLLLLAAAVCFASCASTQSAGDCGPDSCEGCCDASGKCRTGNALDACGANGASCAVCSGAQTCSAGTCNGDEASDAGSCDLGDGHPPTGRSDFAAAFDPGDQQLIVFGGDPGTAQNCTSNPEFSGETWLYDVRCGSWTQLQGAGPSPRSRSAGVFDSKRRRFVVFGGRYREGNSGAYTVYNDVHALILGPEGSHSGAWDELATTGTPPPPLSSTAAVYDPVGDRMLVFGGNSSTNGATFTPDDRLWALSFEDNAWTELVPASGPKPAARLFHAAALDAKRNRLIVFGGGDANAFFGPFFNDVWAFDLAAKNWTKLSPAGDPPMGRIRASLLEDPERDWVLLFGGHDDGELGERNDVWALDFASNTWFEMKTGDTFQTPGSGFCDFPSDFTKPDLDSPERREAHAFLSAPGLGALMFGGRTDCGVVNDVWTYDAAHSQWSQQQPTFTGLSCQRSGKTSCTKLCF